MQTFEIQGGIHPAYRKELASEQAIRPLPLPKRFYIPLQQHVGAVSVPIVAVGEHVRKGQVLCVRQGSMSATQHAPTSGQVVAIDEMTAPHPSGLADTTIVIEADGLDEWAELPPPIADPLAAPPQEIVDRVALFQEFWIADYRKTWSIGFRFASRNRLCLHLLDALINKHFYPVTRTNRNG